MLRPASRIWPESGSSSRRRRRMNVVLPEPEVADEEDELALLDLDTDVAQRDGRSLVGLGDVYELDHRSGEVSPRRGNRAPARSYRLWPRPSGHRLRCRSQQVSVPGTTSCAVRYAPLSRWRRSSASMKASRSPSRTASTLPVSWLVRRSLTSWYGAMHVGADLVPPGVVHPLAAERVELGPALGAGALGQLGPEDLQAPWPCSGAGCARSGTTPRSRSAGG